MDEHAKHLLLGFAGLVAVWFILGGPKHEIAREGVYLHPLAPLDSGTAYGGKYLNTPTTTKTDLVLPKTTIDVKKIEQEVSDFTSQSKLVQTEHDISYLSKNIIIDGKAGAGISEPNREYIRLLTNDRNVEKISISGFVLKSGVTGLFGTIPLGTLVPLVGQVSELGIISLDAGDRAIVSTGESPIGSSFKLNICSGYLEQFQDYTPTLRFMCPFPTDELKNTPLENDSACKDFVASIPRCNAYTGSIPRNLSSGCRTFITQNLTYNGCVAKHKGDKGFFDNEWRIFLGKNTEQWKNSQEIIKLIDLKGNTVDAITY